MAILIETDKYELIVDSSDIPIEVGYFLRKSDGNISIIPQSEDLGKLSKALRKLDRIGYTREIDRIAEGYNYE